MIPRIIIGMVIEHNRVQMDPQQCRFFLVLSNHPKIPSGNFTYITIEHGPFTIHFQFIYLKKDGDFTVR